MDSQITAYEVMAFTTQVSEGSPTGVVLIDNSLRDDQMQHLAKVLGYSHTVFIEELTQEVCDVRVRFFTPVREIKNCGHATIAAHALRTTQNPIQNNTLVRQQGLSGLQVINISYQGGVPIIHLKQDEIVFTHVEEELASELLSALNIPVGNLDERYPIILASPGSNRFLVGLKDPETLISISPNFSQLMNVCDRVNSIGCFVFTVDSIASSVEALGRMFAPGIGVDEDIVNGNSSGCLGAYLLQMDTDGRIGSELSLRIHQGHTFNRPGTVVVSAKLGEDKIETSIGGTAVIASQKQIDLCV